MCTIGLSNRPKICAPPNFSLPQISCRLPKARDELQRREITGRMGIAGACTPEKFFNLKSLKYHFLDFSGRFYTILQKTTLYNRNLHFSRKVKVSSGEQYFRVLHLVYVILDPGSIDQKGIYCPKRQSLPHSGESGLHIPDTFQK